MLETNIKFFIGNTIADNYEFSRYIYLEIDGDRLGLKVEDSQYNLSEDGLLLGLKAKTYPVDESSINPEDIEQTLMDLIPSGNYYNINEFREIVSTVKNHFNQFNDYHYVAR